MTLIMRNEKKAIRNFLRTINHFSLFIELALFLSSKINPSLTLLATSLLINGFINPPSNEIEANQIKLTNLIKRGYFANSIYLKKYPLVFIDNIAFYPFLLLILLVSKVLEPIEKLLHHFLFQLLFSLTLIEHSQQGIGQENPPPMF